MSRKNRYFTAGRLWHVTHRCHNRDFLLRWRRDRDAYRSLLREKARGSGVDLYAYCLTSNHVHVLLRSIEGEGIAPLMKSVAANSPRPTTVASAAAAPTGVIVTTRR